MLEKKKSLDEVLHKQEVIGILMDESNTSAIVLRNDRQREIRFRQIFAATVDEKVYCLLYPVTPVVGLDNRAALVFEVTDDDKFTLITDPQRTRPVFERYYKALRESA